MDFFPESQTQKPSVPSSRDVKNDLSHVCSCSKQNNHRPPVDLEDELLPAKLWLRQRAEQLKRKT